MLENGLTVVAFKGGRGNKPFARNRRNAFRYMIGMFTPQGDGSFFVWYELSVIKG